MPQIFAEEVQWNEEARAGVLRRVLLMSGGCLQGKERRCRRLQMGSFDELSIVIIVMHDNRFLCGYRLFRLSYSVS